MKRTKTAPAKKRKSGFTAEFEDIADAIGVFQALKDTDMVRMLEQGG